MTKLWVVEMLVDGLVTWEPTVGARRSRDAGRDEIKRWRENNPDDRFRLVCYQRVERGRVLPLRRTQR